MQKLSFRLPIVISLAAMLTVAAFATPNLYAADTDTAVAEKLVATTPVPRDGWWMKRHEEKLAKKAEMDNQVDLLMIGDSITQGWEGHGKDVWAKYYADRKPLNIGYSGDRTEHVLWRFNEGEIDDISPKLAVVMIGTNNIGHGSSTPAETLIGIKAILDQLEKRLPDTKVLLLAVFARDEQPDGKFRKQVNEINAGLPKLADGKRVILLDINEKFLDDNGVLPKSIMPDSLHPRAEGYGIWVEAMEPSIKKMMGEK